MFYREAGQYKTSYRADQALYPIRQDQIGIALILAAAYVLVPLTASNFMIDSVLTPVLIFSLAAIGLNLLTGYTGLLSLGTGGFMGVGAFACYKLATYFPGINIVVLVIC
jgi:branched-chain amino acid transport system permease protein